MKKQQTNQLPELVAVAVPPDQREARRMDKFRPRLIPAGWLVGGAIDTRRAVIDTPIGTGVSSACQPIQKWGTPRTE